MHTETTHRDRPSTPSPAVNAIETACAPSGPTEIRGEHLVRHLAHSVASGDAPSGKQVRGEVAAVLRGCIRLTGSTLDETDTPHDQDLTRLRRACAQWARRGVPIHTIHHAIHQGMTLVLNQCTATADVDTLAEIGRRLVQLMSTLSTTAAAAYTAELATVLGDDRSTMDTLVTALLEGRPSTTVARECGAPIYESYFVIAASIAQPHRNPPQRDQHRDHDVHTSLRHELHSRCETALSLPGAEHSTILIPTPFGDQHLDPLLAHLAHCIGTPLTATVIPATTADIPAAHRQAHELLAVAKGTRRGPGLYRFGDLAVQYQLTRPGPGRESLRSVLTPLDAHPVLQQTLTRYLLDFNKKRTARALHVHPNTVHYRLKRIADLVGVDPSTARGAWRLHSALLARGIANLPPPDRCPR